MAVDVKICGLTRKEDVALAVRHGAARLGVIFAGGPRLRTVAEAADLVRAAEAVPVIGVFGHQSAAEILEISARAGLSGAQLHGPSDAAIARQLRESGLEVWQVLRVPDTPGVPPLVDWGAGDVLLLEPRVPGEPSAAGGRGFPIDLAAARAARLAIGPSVRIGLAGGLTPERLGEAIRLVKPDIVDVSSGVEIAPGIKDHTRLIRFLEIARDAHPTA